MKLLEALKSATADDLQQIDDRIAELQSELDTLTTARKLVNLAVNGKPEKPVRAPRGQGKTAQAAAAKQEEMQQRREAVYDLLSKEGSMPLVAIATRLGIHHIAVRSVVVDHEWFEIARGEVHIRKSAKRS